MKQKLVLLALGALALGMTSCKSLPMDPSAAQANFARSDNGSAGQLPAYYDDVLFTVNMMEISDDAAEHMGEANQAEIYTTRDLDEEQDFFPVIDAIPGDSNEFSPLWHQFLIVFNSGFTPRQFTNEEDIDAAAEGSDPEITIVDTHEVYRCSVVGKKGATD